MLIPSLSPSCLPLPLFSFLLSLTFLPFFLFCWFQQKLPALISGSRMLPGIDLNLLCVTLCTLIARYSDSTAPSKPSSNEVGLFSLLTTHKHLLMVRVFLSGSKPCLQAFVQRTERDCHLQAPSLTQHKVPFSAQQKNVLK
jgi:hypothetical protein